MKLLITVAAGSLAVLAGCSISEPSSDVAAETESAIIYGTASTAAQNAVVMLMHYDPATSSVESCTGTLVAKNLVLTARHCVSNTDASSACSASGVALRGGRIHADYEAESIYVFTGTRAPDPTDPTTGPVARGAAIVATSATTLCNSDIAFVILDRDVAGPTASIRSGAPSVGEKITAVGWGVTDVADSPPVRQQRTDIEILDVGPSTASPDGEFIVGESICSGDSGGPALDASGKIVGVVSRGGNGRASATAHAAGCTGADTRNRYTRVSAFPTLVAAAFRAAASVAP